MSKEARAQRNDEIRRLHQFGPDTSSPAVVTAGVSALGPVALESLIRDFIAFDDFAEDVDLPHGERDFGALHWEGQEVWFKMDLSEENKDARIITFLLPEEY